MNINEIILNKDVKDITITPPKGCEIDSINTESGNVIITFKNKKSQYPKSWEEFCDWNPIKDGEAYINGMSDIYNCVSRERDKFNRNILPNHETAEAVLTLCQLIQLMKCYNGDWVPNWNNMAEKKYTIIFSKDTIEKSVSLCTSVTPLYFKTAKLRDLFVENFRELIEKLKPLYGIREGGEQ